MKARSHDPRRLDVEDFAADAERLEGRWDLGELHRLRDSVIDGVPPTRAVPWSAQGELRRPRAADPEVW
jgi:uncharacterized protein